MAAQNVGVMPASAAGALLPPPTAALASSAAIGATADYWIDHRAALQAALDDADLAIGEALRCEEDRLAVTTTVGAFEALATANAACAAMLAEVPKPLPPPVRRLPADFDDTLA